MLTPEVSRERVDNFLSDHFASLEQATLHQGEAYQRMIGITRDVALAGGKRLRPFMSMLMYEAYSGNSSEKVLPVAAAQEVMHLAMLIHDDIMDGDLVRHGEPNVTARVFEEYKDLIPDEVERRRRAEHSALLMGDLLVGEAYGLTDDIDGIDPRVMGRTRRLFRTAMRTVVGGQLDDFEAPFIGERAASPRRIAHDKTAHYTFVTPLLVGATLAEAPGEELDKLQKIGETTGIAYQLRDDILGVFGDPKVTGKSADGDLREDKRTLLSEVFGSVASAEEKERFEMLQGYMRTYPDDPTPARHLRTLLQPAKQIVEREIQGSRTEVTQLIGELAVRSDYRRALKKLVVRSLDRDH